MAKILEQIGTPLQLAALFLLLLAGIARALLRSGSVKFSPALTRLLVNRFFALALAGIVLGLLAPTAITLFGMGRDETYYGAVRSTANMPIAGASVELLTIATVPTNSLGLFTVTVPSGRVLKEYRVQVTAPGYKTPDPLVRSSAQMRTFEVQLEPQPRALVKQLEQPLLVGQFFGLPFAVATLRVENAATATVPITDIRATLSGAGVTYGLAPATWTIAGQWGPYAPIGGPIPIFAGAQLDLRVMLALPSNLNPLFAQLAALPEYQARPACTSAPGSPAAPLSPAGFAIVKDFATERFVWTPGEWRLHIEVAAENQVQSFDAPVTLSPQDVAALRTSIALARQCIGINVSAPLAQDGPLANFLLK